MSNFRIIGTENPIVGEKTTYAVSEILPGSHTVGNNSSFKEPIHWSIYQLKRGEWVHKPKNDNLGNTVDYTFIERTIRYEGLRIIAKRGDEIARMNLKTQRAEVGKILKVDLLDYYGNKPTQAFAYGQRVMARVHCVNLDLCVGSVTLWEDDELARTGQNLANKKNTAITLPFEVIDGKAEVIFLLNQSFDKMANARTDAKRDIKTKDEGQLHEYYVTAQILNQATESSNSVAVHNLEAPIAPHKEKITIQQTASAKTPPTIKKGVSRVFLTDTTNQPIKGVFKEKLIKVWIISTGLIGRDICLKLYDEDNLSNDLLLNQNFKIKADTHDVVVSLNTIPRSKGGNYIGEGSEQELFVDIEVLQTQEHTKSAVINVDASVFKQDTMPIIDSMLTVDTSDSWCKEEEKNTSTGNCYCLNKLVSITCNGNGNTISEELYKTEANRLEIEVAVIKAIAKQESKRNSFWKKGQATILFERHKMWKYLKKDKRKTDDELKNLKESYPNIVNGNSGGYGTYAEQYEKLKTAKEIDYSCALKSCSWGKFQVMGFNYDVAFNSLEEMEKAVNKCEIQQFKFFIGYLENTNGLIQAMKDKDWGKIASKYNGSSWKTINPDYANNIKKYYNEFK